MSDTVKKSPLAFHVMAKPMGPICNLDCTYCYYLEKEKLYPQNDKWKMSEKVLETFIRQKIEDHQVPVVSFTWQGGEPTLLGLDYFKKIIEIQKRYSNGKKIENCFQTNGILLNDEWCTFFADNNFLVGISIDGPKEIHDKFRVDKGGKPTFEKVLNGIELLKKYKVEFNTLTVVNNHNVQFPIEIYRFLKEVGSGFMQFLPVAERVTVKTEQNHLKLVTPESKEEAKVSQWSVNAVEYGNFLCEIFDEWVRYDVGKKYVQIFDVALESWMGLEPSLCIFREKCGDALVIEHNGDIYSCDHYVFQEYKLGNILDRPLYSMLKSIKQKKFGNDKFDKLPNYCRKCEYLFACNGECPKHRFINTPDGEPGLNYLCQAYKKFYSHIDPYMQYMVDELLNQRPPANVMKWVKDGMQD